MIFRDVLEEKETLLRPVFDELFDLAKSNQAHEGDLLLVFTKGSFREEITHYSPPYNQFPYTIGPGREGHSENLHKDFINKYLQNVSIVKEHGNYLEQINYSGLSTNMTDSSSRLVEYEGFFLQIEMLIYLKVWEADSFIRGFYQLARLINGDPYDWHFKIADSNRNQNYVTGTRQDIIRKKIRNKFKNKIPLLHDAIERAYKTQLRNSISHSTYDFQQRNIILNNFMANDPSAQLKSISFDEWIHMIHTTITIYKLYAELEFKISNHYISLANLSNNKIPVLLNMKVPDFNQKTMLLQHEGNDMWNWG